MRLAIEYDNSKHPNLFNDYKNAKDKYFAFEKSLVERKEKK
jgi:hypothetical protein